MVPRNLGAAAPTQDAARFGRLSSAAGDNENSSNPRSASLELDPSQAAKLRGIRFQNRFCSSLSIALLSPGMHLSAPPLAAQEAVLVQSPHVQDRAEAWFEVELVPGLVSRLEQAAAAAEAASSPVTLRIMLRQSSPLWRHKLPGIRHLEALFEGHPFEDKSAQHDSRGEGSKSSVKKPGPESPAFQLQEASDHLAVQLGRLECLVMRRKIVRGET